MADSQDPCREAHDKAHAFAREHVSVLAAEIAEWQDTAILRDGKLRELARICTFAARDALSVAEHIATSEALRFLAALSAPTQAPASPAVERDAPAPRFEKRFYDFAAGDDGGWMAWEECSESDYLHYDGRRADVQVRKIVAALSTPAPQEPATSTEQEPARGERTVTDYALEHAEYMAKGAERFIDACDGLAWLEQQRDDGDEGATEEAIYQAKEAVNEFRDGLRQSIYEFRKRRDRAASRPPAASPPEPKTHSGDSVGADGKRPAAAADGSAIGASGGGGQ